MDHNLLNAWEAAHSSAHQSILVHSWMAYCRLVDSNKVAYIVSKFLIFKGIATFSCYLQNINIKLHKNQ